MSKCDRIRLGAMLLMVAAVVLPLPGMARLAVAQEEAPAEADNLDAADREFAEAMASGPEAADEATPAEEDLPPAEPASLNLLDLVLRGGVLMIPIGIMSVVVGIFAIERGLALRRSRIVPEEFVQGLGKLARAPGGLDPRLAYRLCQLHRCPAANVMKAALLKLGRPHNEVEKAVADARLREAEDLYTNVRPISLAMAVTPLIGLLGTVCGMIETFFVVSQSPTGVKVADLAGGIYVALVTTVAGLAVAIPAAFIAHFFEGRIQRLFRHVDDLVQSIMPQLERYEGKLRVSTFDVAAAPSEDANGSQRQATPPPVKAGAGAGAK